MHPQPLEPNFSRGRVVDAGDTYGSAVDFCNPYVTACPEPICKCVAHIIAEVESVSCELAYVRLVISGRASLITTDDALLTLLKSGFSLL